jgi:hypothetical protein
MSLIRTRIACPLLVLAAACSTDIATATATTNANASEVAASAPASGLAPYADDAELARALERWREEAARRQAERRREMQAQSESIGSSVAAPPAPMAAPAPQMSAQAKSASPSKAADSADGITNVQTAGVDEGGIVKRSGDFLVVLRRGRLFTVRVGGDQLQAVAMVDAYAPNADPRGAWYDEMLISGSTVVVVGYSYARGGTEIGLFELDARGGLQHRATHHLRSYDYYSARNYASRLIGRELIFYSPTLLRPTGPQLLQRLPVQRRWTGQVAPADDASWQRILPATRIYRTDDDFDPAQPLALHTVTRCQLGADAGSGELRCASSAVLGPAGRVFYVSQTAVYIWTTGREPGRPEARSAVFRLPLDGQTPTALKTVGVPIDQLSFLEDGHGFLNVLLRAQGAGEGMWGQQRLQGDSALLRVPLSAFGDGRGAAQGEHYRSLPARHPSHNRFVGDWLLMGSAYAPARRAGDARPDAASAPAWAIRYADPQAEAEPLDPGHAVERIEAMGAQAVLVGNAGRDLHFSAVRLDRHHATLAGRHVRPDARQGETRSHGFYYRPTADDEGLLGLPVLETSRAVPGRGARSAASVVFLRERALDFHALGDLRSRPADASQGSDGCKASCVDWYGNARPLFIGDRVFALLGYELVEGRLRGRGDAERLDERRRASFMPQRAPDDGRRYSPFSQ